MLQGSNKLDNEVEEWWEDIQIDRNDEVSIPSAFGKEWKEWKGN